jgi:hypothetical protein
VGFAAIFKQFSLPQDKPFPSPSGEGLGERSVVFLPRWFYNAVNETYTIKILRAVKMVGKNQNEQ